MFGIFFNDLKISWYLLQYPCNPASQHRHIWWLPMLLLVDLPASHRVLKLRKCHDGVETCNLKCKCIGMYWTYSNTNGCRVVFFVCLAMIGSQVQIVLTLLTLTAEFVMVPGFAKASNTTIPILMFDSVILSEIFHLEQKKNHHVRCS